MIVCRQCDGDHLRRDCPQVYRALANDAKQAKGKGKGKGHDKSVDRPTPSAAQSKPVWKHFYLCRCGWTVAPSEATP